MLIARDDGAVKIRSWFPAQLKSAVELRSQRAAVAGSCCCKCSDEAGEPREHKEHVDQASVVYQRFKRKPRLTAVLNRDSR
jgi:hypothetical protein